MQENIQAASVMMSDVPISTSGKTVQKAIVMVENYRFLPPHQTPSRVDSGLHADRGIDPQSRGSSALVAGASSRSRFLSPC